MDIHSIDCHRLSSLRASGVGEADDDWQVRRRAERVSLWRARTSSQLCSHASLSAIASSQSRLGALVVASLRGNALDSPRKMSGSANIARGPRVFWIRVSDYRAEGKRILDDAGARWSGNRLQPGRSGFESHRRLWRRSSSEARRPDFQASGWSRRARGASAPSPDGRRGVFRAGIRNRGGIRSW